VAFHEVDRARGESTYGACLGVDDSHGAGDVVLHCAPGRGLVMIAERADDEFVVAAQLISEGRHLTPEQRAARQMHVIQAGRDYAAGVSTMRPLNPEWDRNLLAVLASGDLEQVDFWSTDWFTEQAGHSAHETRTLIAAYAALAATGPYRVTASFYEPIPAWIAGFAVTTARPASA
jgi:hypothetical protein